MSCWVVVADSSLMKSSCSCSSSLMTTQLLFSYIKNAYKRRRSAEWRERLWYSLEDESRILHSPKRLLIQPVNRNNLSIPQGFLQSSDKCSETTFSSRTRMHKHRAKEVFPQQGKGVVPGYLSSLGPKFHFCGSSQVVWMGVGAWNLKWRGWMDGNGDGMDSRSQDMGCRDVITLDCRSRCYFCR